MRLIDADALIHRLLNTKIVSANLLQYANAVTNMIGDAPTIEAEPVRHGRWIDKGEYAVCTECGGRSGTQYDGVEPIPLMTQFCQNCGAKMGGLLTDGC